MRSIARGKVTGPRVRVAHHRGVTSRYHGFQKVTNESGPQIQCAREGVEKREDVGR